MNKWPYFFAIDIISFYHSVTTGNTGYLVTLMFISGIKFISGAVQMYLDLCLIWGIK